MSKKACSGSSEQGVSGDGAASSGRVWMKFVKENEDRPRKWDHAKPGETKILRRFK